ncbi:MAG: hypothetical protein K2K06_09035 [Oscillospiraceae bacterium]|nr:hypothetical protein [Oscillospiraceae bacterium]
MGFLGNDARVDSEYADTKLEAVAKYEEHYMNLLRNYKAEIAEIESMMRELRKEREIFYQTTLPQIEKTIRGDKVLSEDAKKEWINELRANMEKSFRISEALIQHYVTSNQAEFKEKLNRAMNKV